jgi:NRPS condensation-like uncharacterized protein
MREADLNLLDELYLHLDRDDEPWTVHLEVQAEGNLAPERLREAIREAARKHPIARARLADSRGTDVRYRWEITEELSDPRLDVVDCETDADVAAARERLLATSPRLDRHGPFSVLLARHPDGDSLVLNLHHAAGDGLAALRLMASIARAYGGEHDPDPPVDPLGVRDIRELVSGSVADRLKRSRGALEYLTRGVSRPSRVAAKGETDAPGYGFELLELRADEMERLRERRPDGATVNDVLLGALAVTVRRWNESNEGDTGAAYLMMPINLRPPEWRHDVVGNFASYVSVRVSADEHEGLEEATAATAERTRRIKDEGLAGLIVDLFEAPTALPSAVKRRLQDLIPLTGNVVVDTAVLSNLGKLQAVPHLGDAGAVKAVWFSPPGRMPLGASVGAATLDGALCLTLRYRHRLFGPAAAAEFMNLYRETLLA